MEGFPINTLFFSERDHKIFYFLKQYDLLYVLINIDMNSFFSFLVK